jgi:hypothetical protein
MLAAYAEGFGWDAADALHRFVEENVNDIAPGAPVLIQQDLF